MRHRKAGRKLGVKSKHREAMMRNLVTSLFDHGKLLTTDTRAKELRGVAERLISLTKRDGDPVSLRRRAMRMVRTREALRKLFDEIAPRFASVPGGYTKIIKVGHRVGDAAPVSLIRLLDAEEARQAGQGKGGAKPKRAASRPPSAAAPVSAEG